MAPKKLPKWEGKEEFFKRRFPGFKKKLTELPLLCNNSAVLVCYAPDNQLHVWPEPKESPQAISQMFDRFNAQTDLKKDKNTCHVHDFGHDHLDLDDALGLDQLNTLLSRLDSFLVGLGHHKIGVARQKETEDLIRVSDHKLVLEDVIGTKLGFDQLGSHETVTSLGNDASMKDVVGVDDESSSWLDNLFDGLNGNDSSLRGTYDSFNIDNCGLAQGYFHTHQSFLLTS